MFLITYGGDLHCGETECVISAPANLRRQIDYLAKSVDLDTIAVWKPADVTIDDKITVEYTLRGKDLPPREEE